MVGIAYEWRGEFANTAVNALHAEGFGHDGPGVDWHARVHRHSLGWVCARRHAELVGRFHVTDIVTPPLPEGAASQAAFRAS